MQLFSENYDNYYCGGIETEIFGKQFLHNRVAADKGGA